MRDTLTYGFSKPIAESLAQSVSGPSDDFFNNRQPRGEVYKIIAKTTSTITAASMSGDDIVLGSGTADLFKISSDGTKFELSDEEVTLSNIVLESIASGKIVQAAPIGGKWVVDWELCDD